MDAVNNTNNRGKLKIVLYFGEMPICESTTFKLIQHFSATTLLLALFRFSLNEYKSPTPKKKTNLTFLSGQESKLWTHFGHTLLQLLKLYIDTTQAQTTNELQLQ